MSDQKQKLIEILDSFYGHHDGERVVEKVISAFPQITKKPIEIVLDNGPLLQSIRFPSLYFESKEERQDWVDSHYVEEIK